MIINSGLKPLSPVMDQNQTQAWGLEPQDFPFGDSNSGVSSCFPLGQAQNSRDLYIG